MLKRVVRAGLFAMMVFSPGLLNSSRAESGCSICVLELGTANYGKESIDYVIIGNNTANSISLSSTQLQYYNSIGVYDSKYTMSGTLLSGQVKILLVKR